MFFLFVYKYNNILYNIIITYNIRIQQVHGGVFTG